MYRLRKLISETFARRLHSRERRFNTLRKEKYSKNESQKDFYIGRLFLFRHIGVQTKICISSIRMGKFRFQVFFAYIYLFIYIFIYLLQIEHLIRLRYGATALLTALLWIKNNNKKKGGDH